MPHPNPPREVRASGYSAAASLLSLVCLATAPPVSATTLRKMDLPEIVSLADRVVDARAISSNIYWDPSGTQIYTDTTFEVLAEAKGEGPATLTVTLLGGRIDPIEMREEGTPGFSVGEEVVLFTLQRPDGKSNLVGFTQGVMRVQPEEDSGEKFAVSEVPLGVSLIDPDQTPAAATRPSSLRAPLVSLLDQVRQIVAGTQPPGPVLATTPETDPLGAEGGNP